jgi:hypothetical protein
MSKPSSTFNTSDTADDAHERRKSGRATFDADGRSVWEWQISTGVFTRTVSEDQLMELAQANLQLASDPPSEGDWRHSSDRTRGAADTKRSWPNVRARTTAQPSTASALGSIGRLFRRFGR